MKQTMMTKKYWSMLLAGTVYMSIATALVMSGSVIAGVMVGQDAVSGINLVTPLFCAATFLGSLFSIGVPILYSKEMGAFNKQKADQAFGLGLGMTALLGLAMMVFSLAAGDWYLNFFRPGQNVFLHAKRYLFWMSFVFFVMPLCSYFSEMVIADGDETIPMIAGGVQIFGNIGASALLCRFMGTAGISLGALLSNAVSLMVVLTHLFKKTNSIKPGVFFSWGAIKSVFRYSFIDSSSYLFLAAFSFFIDKFVSWRFGEKALPIAATVLLVTEARLVFEAVGLAIGPIVSLYLSEGVFGGARKIYGLAKRVCMAEGVFLCLAFNIFAPSVPAILGISDPETASLAILCARLISLGYAFTGCLYLASCYYLMREKIKLSFMICFIRDALVSIPAATLAGFFWGPRGMFAGLAAAPFLAAGISALIVRLKYGKAEYPLLITELEKKQKYLWREFDVVPNEIVRIRDEAEAALKARGYGGKFVNRVMTLIEEMFMYVYDKNAGKQVQAECALIMKDGAVEIIEKNNGTVIDFADADMPADSFRAFFTNSIIKGYSLRPRHLIALSCNRNVFRIEERD